MRGTIDGYPARVLIDCGASCNYISERLVSRYQLRTKTFHPPLTIELADGSQSKTSEELLKQRVVLPGFNGRVDLVITTLNQYDVILGIPWFKAYQPLIDWQQGRIVKVADNHDEDMIAVVDEVDSTDDVGGRRGTDPVSRSADDNEQIERGSVKSSRSVSGWSKSRDRLRQRSRDQLPSSASASTSPALQYPALVSLAQVAEIQLIYADLSQDHKGAVLIPLDKDTSDNVGEHNSGYSSLLNLLETSSSNNRHQVFLYGSSTSVSAVKNNSGDDDEREADIAQPPAWLQPVLDRYKDVLNADGPSSLPPPRDEDHRIELVSGARPIKCRSYPLSAKHQDTLRKTLDDLQQ